MRAGAIRAYEATPSLTDRLRTAFAPFRGSVVTPAWTSSNGHAEHEWAAEKERVHVAA